DREEGRRGLRRALGFPRPDQHQRQAADVLRREVGLQGPEGSGEAGAEVASTQASAGGGSSWLSSCSRSDASRSKSCCTMCITASLITPSSCSLMSAS